MNSPRYVIKDHDRLGYMINAICNKIRVGLDSGPVVVTLGRDDSRTAAQNRKLWPMLNDVSKQVVWHGQKPNKEEWKHIFTAALDGQKCYPGIDGGLVFCGISTSKMGKKKFADLIESIYAFGSDQKVHWSEKSLDIYEEYMREK